MIPLGTFINIETSASHQGFNSNIINWKIKYSSVRFLCVFARKRNRVTYMTYIAYRNCICLGIKLCDAITVTRNISSSKTKLCFAGGDSKKNILG